MPRLALDRFLVPRRLPGPLDLHAFLWRSSFKHSCQAFTNSTSRVMVISSPTRIPPVSRAVFQVKPKSFRLIFVVAETAIRVLPQGSFDGGVGPSTAKW